MTWLGASNSFDPKIPEYARDAKVPEPVWIIMGNRVGCPWCGLKSKTRAKYIRHFRMRHIAEDGSWKPAEHKFRLKSFSDEDLTADEQEAIEADERGEAEQNYRKRLRPKTDGTKNWWDL